MLLINLIMWGDINVLPSYKGKKSKKCHRDIFNILLMSCILICMAEVILLGEGDLYRVSPDDT